ncbi:thymus-specific serine protease-like isoform X1 [Acanthaster planci]|uniref:Thymus-specific serine protease-like isoform X1 n=1 Tax=Acanthaster planci TaxID=133434 RepID=A0A8B7ZNX5_ACAPL|nr:thymus-specific serine protease-like isoform X1 [Acanthaster planci]
MKATVLAVVCVVCLNSVQTGALSPYGNVGPRISQLHKRRLWNSVDVADLHKYNLDNDPQARHGYLTQPMDHFDPLVDKHFNQLYWIVDKYWKSPSHPVFLYEGEEAPLSLDEVANGHHAEMAKAHGALILGLEHRFYGNSTTKEGLLLSELQYLSSQQQLADLSVFCVFAEKMLGMSGDNTWIVFGGSYAGALSAWFRLKYPHLVYGSVASSAPVRAQANFEGYNDVVAASFADPIVFGSAQCVVSIKQAFAKVEQMWKAGQLAQIQKDFNTCQDLTEPNDFKTFASNLQGEFMSAAQYNRVEGNSSTIGDLCKKMMVPDPYQALVNIFKSSNCSDVSFKDFLKQLQNTTFNYGSMARQWFYQTCTQFGYYQTCDKNSTCMFLPQVDLDYYFAWCKGIYNIPAADVVEQVNFTNAYYGADHPRGSRVVFVDGTIDPWHALSVLTNLPEDLKSIFMKGTSHCADMAPYNPDDTPALKAGRLAIEKVVSDWLMQAEMEKKQK